MAGRQVAYQWRLREVMAAHGVFTAADLVPLLAEHEFLVSSRTAILSFIVTFGASECLAKPMEVHATSPSPLPSDVPPSISSCGH